MVVCNFKYFQAPKAFRSPHELIVLFFFTVQCWYRDLPEHSWTWSLQSFVQIGRCHVFNHFSWLFHLLGFGANPWDGLRYFNRTHGRSTMVFLVFFKVPRVLTAIIFQKGTIRNSCDLSGFRVYGLAAATLMTTSSSCLSNTRKVVLSSCPVWDAHTRLLRKLPVHISIVQGISA